MNVCVSLGFIFRNYLLLINVAEQSAITSMQSKQEAAYWRFARKLKPATHSIESVSYTVCYIFYFALNAEQAGPIQIKAMIRGLNCMIC
jgi:hypothetical protein